MESDSSIIHTSPFDLHDNALIITYSYPRPCGFMSGKNKDLLELFNSLNTDTLPIPKCLKPTIRKFDENFNNIEIRIYDVSHYYAFDEREQVITKKHWYEELSDLRKLNEKIKELEQSLCKPIHVVITTDIYISPKDFAHYIKYNEKYSNISICKDCLCYKLNSYGSNPYLFCIYDSQRGVGKISFAIQGTAYNICHKQQSDDESPQMVTVNIGGQLVAEFPTSIITLTYVETMSFFLTNDSKYVIIIIQSYHADRNVDIYRLRISDLHFLQLDVSALQQHKVQCHLQYKSTSRKLIIHYGLLWTRLSKRGFINLE